MNEPRIINLFDVHSWDSDRLCFSQLFSISRLPTLISKRNAKQFLWALVSTFTQLSCCVHQLWRLHIRNFCDYLVYLSEQFHTCNSNLSLGIFFSKRCISFGQECMVLNPGVFFNSGYCNSWEQARSSPGPGTPLPGSTSGKTSPGNYLPPGKPLPGTSLPPGTTYLRENLSRELPPGKHLRENLSRELPVTFSFADKFHPAPVSRK